MRIFRHHLVLPGGVAAKKTSGESPRSFSSEKASGSARPDRVRVGLSPDVVADPAVNAKRQAYRDGQVIVDAHEPADSVYFIHRGQVRTYHATLSGRSEREASSSDADSPNPCMRRVSNTERLVSILGPDDWFGSSALAGQRTTCMRAVTHGPTVVSRVDVARLMAALAENPLALLALTRGIAAKLEEARIESTSLMFDDCQRRLLRKLLALSHTAAATAFSDGSIEVRITHQQIAQAIGVARESVSLCLGELRSIHALSTGRNRVTFLPSKLSVLLN